MVVAFLRGLLGSYTRAMASQPLATQMTTSSVLWLAGDVMAQKAEGKTKIDWRRTRGMVAVGAFVAGPSYALWYPRLHRMTAPIKNTTKRIGAKIAIDQFVFTPPYLAAFFISSKLFEGKTIQDGIESIKDDYIQVFLADSLLWPGVQAINFKFVPVQYNALVVNSVCVGWNCFLSHMTHRDAHGLDVHCDTSTAANASTTRIEADAAASMEPCKAVILPITAAQGRKDTTNGTNGTSNGTTNGVGVEEGVCTVQASANAVDAGCGCATCSV